MNGVRGEAEAMLKIAIVEDDKFCSEQISDYVKRFSEENQTPVQVTLYHDGMDIADGYKPIYDLIFLDIEMPLLDGMTAAERIRELDPEVLLIFITNLAQYAIRGYSVNALDYILKPVKYAAFAMKLQKARRILEKRESRSLLLSADGVSRKVPVSAIRYVEVLNHQLVYHTEEGDFREFKSLRQLESELGEGFARCNHCYLVNLRYVDGVKDDDVLIGTEKLKISRTRKQRFMRTLSDFCRFGGR